MKLLGLFLMCVAGVSAAQQTLPDPTRPPLMVAPASQGAEGQGEGPRLQSVLLPKQGRPLAVIDGRPVRLGEKLGEGRLIRVSEVEVVLSGPQGIQRLPLTPDVEKVAVQDSGGHKNASGKKKEKP